jgi:MFS transporter, DHA1 family, tetracycline resistance protein
MAQKNLALTFILITVTLDAIGIGLMFPVMPELIEGLTGLGIGQAALWGGILSAAFAIMQFLCGPALGALSDRYGRRPILLVSLFVMGLDYLVMAAAPTIWLLLIARVISGVTAATYSTATAFIADITPPEDRGRRFGLIGAGFGVGFVLGPLIGGLLATIDLHAPFYAAAALAFANMAFGFFVLPETVTDATRRPFAMARANPFSALRAVSRLPGIRRTLLVFLILSISMGVYASIWSYFGHAAFGWSSTMVGVSLAVYGISFAFGQALLVGPLIRRFGEAQAATFGMCVNIVTLVALGLASAGWMALLITPFTALGGVVTPALQSIASRATPANAQGELQGVMSSLTAIATITAPLIMTNTFAAFTGPAAPVHLPGAPFLLAAGLMIICVTLHVAGTRAQARNPA